MSSYPALDKLRIGCVQYLNAKPLIHAYPGKVAFDHPAKLADALEHGDLDVALVSTFELLRMPNYVVADGVSIASQGEVYSVFLAYQGDLKEVNTVLLDRASLTGAHLLRCILSEYHGLNPDYVSTTDGDDDGAARLLIGNQAIDFRRANGDAYQYLDLGAEWLAQTGLPFVFAVWLIRADLPEAPAAAIELRSLKEDGISHIPEIASCEECYGSAFATHYLCDHIRYNLDDPGKAAIVKFRELLAKHGHIAAADAPFVFV